MSETFLSVAAWSRFPSGALRSYGEWSGEAWREDVLAPALREFDTVHVDLNGVLGFGAAWLEEAFAGLLRHGFTLDEVRRRLRITSTLRSNLILIEKYVNEEGLRQLNSTLHERLTHVLLS